MKTPFATAALSACLALGAFPAFAAGPMGQQDHMGMDKTPMAGQAMHKGQMGMDKTSTSPASMAKGGETHQAAMDPMGKTPMDKGSMDKGSMQK
ncbi:MAG: hypothetical protein WA909_01245 [Castellaniella sp.]|uniref:pentapeptide MXKDX repeat protein n=1 Tax=Castellaniella sp. TaxID=1955812 RepID=UPI003C75F411